MAHVGPPRTNCIYWSIESHQLLLSARSQTSSKKATIKKNLSIVVSCHNPMFPFRNKQNLYSCKVYWKEKLTSGDVLNQQSTKTDVETTIANLQE